MELKQQVTSLEISKRLKKLGVKQKSYFMWAPDKKGYGLEIRKKVNIGYERSEYVYSAFTVSELGEMLKKTGRNIENSLPFWFKKEWYTEYYGADPAISSANEADARGKMLIYLLEKNLIPHSDEK